MDSSLTTPRFVRALGVALVVGLVVLAVHAAVSAAGPDPLFDSWLYNGLVLGAGVVCLVRAALVRDERAAWLLMGLGMLSWTAGEIYWAVELTGLEEVPIPSTADGLYLAFYPAAYATLMLLVRSRIGHTTKSMWLDGAIAALAVAALAAATVLPKVVDTAAGDTAAVITNLAYPVGDVVLLSLVIAVFGICSWRPGRAFLLLGLGMAVMAVADVNYLLQSANGTYVEGGIYDPLWPACAVIIAAAAWQRDVRPEADFGRLRVVLVPVASSVLALGVLAMHNLGGASDGGTILALGALLLVTMRMALTFRDNQRMLSQSRTEALTDALTELPNRRSLMRDLQRELAFPGNGRRGVIMFDLDGFKQYNDSYGHPAGDALLARLGRRLRDVAAPYGRAYRMGGDEFCALVRTEPVGMDVVVAATAAALTESGEGFQIGASHGEAIVPDEVSDPSEALQLADRRMYAQKGGRTSSAGRQTRDVLLSTLRERQPDLHLHLRDVAELALRLGRRFQLSPEDLDVVARAAELHDVGKIAIPDAILNKPEPLDENEWEFMRRHTIIGQRILDAAPALQPVARLVRSTHERFDGDGYPDGLAGEEIPLGARIVAVCDAYDAMIAHRPYREARTPEGALAELRACAGTQFDPRVVDAFAEVVAEAPFGVTATPA